MIIDTSMDTVFYARHSLGLIWVREQAPSNYGERGDHADHGPFMDMEDAKDQCGNPQFWVVR